MQGDEGRLVVNSEFELIQYNENLPARIEFKPDKVDTP